MFIDVDKLDEKDVLRWLTTGACFLALLASGNANGQNMADVYEDAYAASDIMLKHVKRLEKKGKK